MIVNVLLWGGHANLLCAVPILVHVRKDDTQIREAFLILPLSASLGPQNMISNITKYIDFTILLK